MHIINAHNKWGIQENHFIINKTVMGYCKEMNYLIYS